jgi:hypothetical protein
MKRWFDYNIAWIENKDRLEILYLNYEDLVNEKGKVISILSKFINIEIDEVTMERVLQRTSFDFMKKHESKFGEQPDHKVYNNFIRAGRVGDGKSKFTERQLGEYHELSRKYRIQGTNLQRYFE